MYIAVLSKKFATKLLLYCKHGTWFAKDSSSNMLSHSWYTTELIILFKLGNYSGKKKEEGAWHKNELG